MRRLTSTPCNSDRQISQSLTSLLRSIDFDEEAEVQGFTTLHKIVCGIDVRDLDSELDLNPDSINDLDIYGKSALWYSVVHDSPDFVRCLLKRGADPNAGGKSVIAEAIRVGSPEILELLIVSGFDSRDLNTEYLLVMWRYSGWYKTETYETRFLSIDRLMIKHLVDVNWQSRHGETMLMTMCERMRPDASRIEQLIRYGADLEINDNNGRTALLYTFFDPYPEAFRTLVRAGARLDVRSHLGYTILHAAVLPTFLAFRTLEVLEAMGDLDLSGLDLDARDEDGFTAFDLLKKRNGVTWEGYCESKRIYHDYSFYPRTPKEFDIIRSLESLFHHIQDSQGIPLAQQYSPLANYLCEKTDEDVIPGAWPV